MMIEIERVAIKILRGDFAEATRGANGRAIGPTVRCVRQSPGAAASSA